MISIWKKKGLAHCAYCTNYCSIRFLSHSIKVLRELWTHILVILFHFYTKQCGFVVACVIIDAIPFTLLAFR